MVSMAKPDTRHHFLDDARQQIVGPHARERAGVPAEGRAQATVDVGFEHCLFPNPVFSCTLRHRPRRLRPMRRAKPA